MSKSNTRSVALPPPATRTMISLFAPVIIGVIVTTAVQRLVGSASSLADSAIFLGGIGLASLYLGMSWYGSDRLGLRGGRPFFSGAGFAFLGWIALLVARLALVAVDETLFLQEPLLPSFFYLLLFESFAVQLWAFGLLFRSAADWRGPLTGAVVSGLAFAVIGYLTFQESFQTSFGAILYFLAWGLFYGLVRLRTGSLLGIVLIQAMQTLTGWFFIVPVRPVTPLVFNSLFYTYMGIWYAVLIWRLWPTEESDYRV